MKITISGRGADPDDSIVEFTVVAETADYKGTMSFYGYADVFDDFARQLLDFPFESKKPVTFSDTEGYVPSKQPIFHIELADAAGHIELTVKTEDEFANYARFTSLVETESLHNFARMLMHADFRNETAISWESR